jgi:hypothetical protein
MRHGYCLKATRPRPEDPWISPSKDGSELVRGADVKERGSKLCFFYLVTQIVK